MTLVKLIDIVVQAVTVMTSKDPQHRALRIGLWLLVLGGVAAGVFAASWALVQLPVLIR